MNGENMEYYKITDKKLIYDIIWWVNDSEEYDTPLEFLEGVLEMCKNNECMVDSLTVARITASCSEMDESCGSDCDDSKEWFDDLEITSLPEEPDEIIIPKELYDKFRDYFDNLTFEDKLSLLLSDTAEVLGSCHDYDEKGDQILYWLIKIKDNPTKEDIRKIIKFIDS